MSEPVILERATLDHLDALLRIEEQCFSTDRISRRSMRRFLQNAESIFHVARAGELCIGYLLTIFHPGTRLARLYSIAVDASWRGKGVARQLMLTGEREAKQRGALYFRLEVNHTNTNAIRMYESLGFVKFGVLHGYYEDNSDALRMQKQIRHHDRASIRTPLPWYQQETSFTCGPAALMMAMAGISPQYRPDKRDELQIWREATTIFMNSGHGGCHPLGLALAAKKRGFRVEVWINQRQPLFVEGVRCEKKKGVIEAVHNDFVKEANAARIPVRYADVGQSTLVEACEQGAVPIMLISTFRMDRKKSPHWVAVSGYDDFCFYVHDPDPDEKYQDLIDCQYMPISRRDFDPMSSFGGKRLRTAVILYPHS
jgi:ribosomal protein S18 acetylase RimI-like enzyme